MAHICQVHPYEVAEGLCRSCGGPFCADCLVYPFGPVKPPYCVPCAVTASGVRTTARNPTVVVPKETKRRLKEWRQARKRDLDSPPPDGVATWQKMDEAEAADEEDTAVAQAAAEREALRLPPPQPETPTPPPGVNLAPPGPPGRDWRDEIAVSDAATFNPPGRDSATDSPAAAAIAGESALGAGWAGGDPMSHAEIVPIPEPLSPAPASHAEPVTTYAGPAADRTPAHPPPDPHADRADAFEGAFDGDPLLDFDSTFGAEPTTEPRPGLDGGFDGDARPDLSGAFAPTATFSGALDDGPTFGGTFEPTPFEPEPVTAPFTIEFDADPLAAFGLGGGEPAGPLPPPPPAAEGHAFDPLPPLGADPGAPPAPPAAEPLVPPPPAPVVAPHTRTTATPAMPRLTPPSPPTRHRAPDVPRSAIRPPTPTRIPAAKSEGSKGSDAKAMLARIAALRTGKTD